jgi:uncharacterized cupredoxin-like copper-binding protein
MRRAAAALAALALAATACAGDKQDTAGTDAKADREVAITTTDALRFEPATVTAKAGETIRFVITNNGRVAHEFAIGSQKYQDEASKAGGHGGGHGGDSKDGAVVAVPAGKTARLTFTMPDSPPLFACHVDNHDDAGMKGAISYG